VSHLGSHPDIDSLSAHALTVKIGFRSLLSQVSLSLSRGEVAAIIGPSGSGKSTLLKALCGVSRPTDGHVYVGQSDFYQHFDQFRQSIGYVPQDDIIHRELTVQEALTYVGRLRLPSDAPPEFIKARVDEVLGQVDLIERRHLPIHKLSGGQRKRASIASELITAPPLLFLDEPTSGLDPALELNLMQLMQRLAKQGRIVFLTTHVMSNLPMMDKIGVVVEGRLLHWGTPADALSHFRIHHFDQLFTRLSGGSIEPLRQSTEPATNPPNTVDQELSELKSRMKRPPE